MLIKSYHLDNLLLVFNFLYIFYIFYATFSIILLSCVLLMQDTKVQTESPFLFQLVLLMQIYGFYYDKNKIVLLVSLTSYLLFPSAVLYKSSLINGEYCVIRFFPLFTRTLTYIIINIGKGKQNGTSPQDYSIGKSDYLYNNYLSYSNTE